MNTPLVSIIVPTKNSGATIERCLRSIREQTYSACELIVVDNFSTDETANIARRYTKHVILQGSHRSPQRNRGAKEARGDYLFFIDSDMILSPTVVSECVDTLRRMPRLQALSIPEESIGVGFWAACKRLERSMIQDVPWLRGARFVRRGTFEAVGVFYVMAAEDFDFSQRIAQQFGDSSLGHINAVILHDEQRLSLLRTCKKKFVYGTEMRRYISQHPNHFMRQFSPRARYAIFFSHPKELFRHPLIGIGMLFMKFCEFVSGGAGYLLSYLRPA